MLLPAIFYVRDFESPIVVMNEGTVCPRMIALVTTLTHLYGNIIWQGY